MSDAGFIELADPASGVQTWLGAGLPGLGEGELLVIASQTDTLIAAGTTTEGSFEIGDDGISARAAVDGIEVEGAARAEGSTLQIRRDGEEQDLNPAAIGGPAPEATGEALLVRIISVVPSTEGSAVTASAARCSKAPGHDGETLRAQVSSGEGAREVFEPLLSTQYDATAGQARAGLELWVAPEDAAPLRVSGLRRLEVRLGLAGGWEVRAAPFIWALDGQTTAGSYLIWRRAGDPDD